MAYALVGSVGTVATGAGFGSVSPAFAQATTAGNLLVAWVAAVASGTISGTQNWVNPTGTVGSCVMYKANCAANETPPTLSTTASGVVFAALAEFSGGATSLPPDQQALQSSTTITPLVITAGGIDATPGELVLVLQIDKLTKAGTVTTSHTYNNGATANANLNNDASSTVDHYRFSWGTTTGNSAADNCSLADNSKNITNIKGALQSFKLAALAAHSLVYADQRVTRNSLLRR